MFHLREGFYFERTEEGGARIVVRESAHVDAPVLRELAVPAEEWASVVASVGARGEDGQTFSEALAFQKGD